LGRTECGSRIIFDLPPTVRAAFDGAPSLEADIEYAFQTAADGTGSVVEVQGVDFVVQQLATAAGMSGEAALGDHARTYNPSFDCGGKLSNVERMICQDEELARLDRALAARYAQLRTQVAATDWQSVADGQKAFLQRRGACADTACVRDSHAAQMRYYNQFETVGGPDN
jgi:uncharacterized protein YecT (DUF1311 family)